MSAVSGNVIGDRWAGGRETLAKINPSATRDVISPYARADATGPNAAVEAAKAAFPAYTLA